MFSLAIALVLSAPAIDLTHATTSLGARAGSWLHGAENLWDGRDDTAWCAGTGEAGERIFVTFDAPIRADGIRVAPGDSIKFGKFKPANRPARVSISNGSYVWQILMPDDAESFTLPVPPPITGKRLVIRIDEVYDHGAKTTCLAGLTFIQDGKPIGIHRDIDRGKGTIEGVWVLADKEAPEVFLTFMRDGRVRAQQEPIDDTPPPPIERGKWSRDAEGQLIYTLNMEKEKVRAHIRPSPDGRSRLVMDGRFKGEWVPFVPQLSLGGE